MMSVIVAITEANKENGCLQVIKGSHKMGRVEHDFAGEQVGTSQRYVGLSLQIKDLVCVEIAAGDVLFFIVIYCIVPKPIYPTTPVGQWFLVIIELLILGIETPLWQLQALPQLILFPMKHF